jgi:FtsZ-interacting cell division protein ZipA
MTTQTSVILIVAIIAIGVAALILLRRRTKKLKSKFGPEYERAVYESGSTFKAEKELEHRAKRVEKLRLRHLNNAEAEGFAREWQTAQEKFVDDPRGAVADADLLVQETMKARGYPTGGEFDAQAADLSVDHPFVISNYRAAHEIAVRDGRAPASTEDLRLAMRHYRALFEDLLDRKVEEITGARR